MSRWPARCEGALEHESLCAASGLRGLGDGCRADDDLFLGVQGRGLRHLPGRGSSKGTAGIERACALEQHDIGQGRVLTCQSHLTGGTVVPGMTAEDSRPGDGGTEHARNQPALSVRLRRYQAVLSVLAGCGRSVLL